MPEGFGCLPEGLVDSGGVFVALAEPVGQDVRLAADGRVTPLVVQGAVVGDLEEPILGYRMADFGDAESRPRTVWVPGRRCSRGSGRRPTRGSWRSRPPARTGTPSRPRTGCPQPAGTRTRCTCPPPRRRCGRRSPRSSSGCGSGSRPGSSTPSWVSSATMDRPRAIPLRAYSARSLTSCSGGT